MPKEYIEREAAMPDGFCVGVSCQECPFCDDPVKGGCKVARFIDAIPAADVVEIPEEGIEFLSDGYHTFNSLYFQRLVLFAALVKAYKDRAWKSWKHEDGEPCFGGGWFIVGIDTPHGSYTYHYEGKDFDMFECEELPVAKHWDGHTDAHVTRLLSLPDVVERPRWIPVTERLPKKPENYPHCELRECYFLVALESTAVVSCAYDFENNRWRESFKVTHWMPLPDPPSKEG